MKKLIFIVTTLFIIYYLDSILKNNLNNDLGNDYKYINLGHDYWQSIFKGDEEVVPVKVVEYHFNDDYILVVRIIVELYECYDKSITNFISSNSNYLDTVTKHTLEYWLINKRENIAYISENKYLIEKKIKSSGISLNFEKKDYKNNTIMIIEEKGLNENYTCILSNSSNQKNLLKEIRLP